MEMIKNLFYIVKVFLKWAADQTANPIQFCGYQWTREKFGKMSKIVVSIKINNNEL